MKKMLWLVLCLLILCCGGISWAEELVNATGKLVWGDTQKKWAHLEGNVRIVQGKTVITTDKAEIDLDKKLLYLKSRLQLVSAEVSVEADELDYNLKLKQGTFRGNVIMNRLEVKDNKGNTSKEAFKLMADSLYFETDTKNFAAKGQARVEHKDFTGSADQIDYHDNKQELLFQNNSFLRKTSGEEIRGNAVKIDLTAKSFRFRENVNMNIQVNDDDKKD